MFTSQTIRDGEQRGPEHHMVAFVTTGTTVELITRLKVIRAFSLSAAGSPDATEQLSLNETVSDFGEIVVPADGNITIKRAAGVTSGLIVSVVLFGY